MRKLLDLRSLYLNLNWSQELKDVHFNEVWELMGLAYWAFNVTLGILRSLSDHKKLT